MNFDFDGSDSISGKDIRVFVFAILGLAHTHIQQILGTECEAGLIPSTQLHSLSLSLHSLCIAMQSYFGPWPFFFLRFRILYAVCRTPWTRDQSIAKSLPTHRIKADRYICLEWDSNPRSQCSSERRQFMP
jgi:hypothetical protein